MDMHASHAVCACSKGVGAQHAHLHELLRLCHALQHGVFAGRYSKVINDNSPLVRSGFVGMNTVVRSACTWKVVGWAGLLPVCIFISSADTWHPHLAPCKHLDSRPHAQRAMLLR